MPVLVEISTNTGLLCQNFPSSSGMDPEFKYKPFKSEKNFPVFPLTSIGIKYCWNWFSSFPVGYSHAISTHWSLQPATARIHSIVGLLRLKKGHGLRSIPPDRHREDKIIARGRAHHGRNISSSQNTSAMMEGSTKSHRIKMGRELKRPIW